MAQETLIVRSKLSRSCNGIIRSALFLCWAITAAAEDFSEHEKWVAEAEAAYADVTSYTAIVHKQQRVRGRLLPEETVFMKFRKPLSMYLNWVKAPYKDSELLYVAGWNENRVRAHRGGFWDFVTRNLDPRAPELMADNLRPVTDIGIGQLIKSVAVNVRSAIEAGYISVAQLGEEIVYGRKTRILDVDLPAGTVGGYGGYRLVINQDAESKLLIRIRVYDRAGQLVENYGYEDLHVNAVLTDSDFDPDNPGYHF
jgi:outer membrane lipoprotein-sorting protein